MTHLTGHLTCRRRVRMWVPLRGLRSELSWVCSGLCTGCANTYISTTNRCSMPDAPLSLLAPSKGLDRGRENDGCLGWFGSSISELALETALRRHQLTSYEWPILSNSTVRQTCFKSSITRPTRFGGSSGNKPWLLSIRQFLPETFVRDAKRPTHVLWGSKTVFTRSEQ
jgi:hypothetical protein